MRCGSGRIRHVSPLLALAAAACLSPLCASAADLAFSRRDPITAQLEAPGAVAVDAEGNVYVAEPGRNRIVSFDGRGKHRTTLSGLDRPLCLAVDGGGRIYVGNAGRGNVEIYGPDLTLRGRLGSGNGEFGRPSGIAVDAAGTAYVTDSRENLVKVYRHDGSRLFAFGGGADEGTAFQFPAAIALDAAVGELIVTDLRAGLASRGSYGGARVQVFTTGGAFLRSFGHYGRGEGLLVKPLGVTTDGSGNVYVSDAFQNVVQVFDRGGAYRGPVHDAGHPLRTPLGIAFSPKRGTLLVCSLTAERVDTFDVTPPVVIVPPFDPATTTRRSPSDFNGDGRSDLLWLDPASRRVSIWLIDRDLRPHPYPVASAQRLRLGAVADAGGDDKADLLWRSNRGVVTLWSMDGAAIAAVTILGAIANPDWKIAGMADFDGDGDADVLWRHARSGALRLWELAGNAVRTDDRLGSPRNPAWKIAALADFDGDGRADILWRHGRTGALQLWSMSAAGVRPGDLPGWSPERGVRIAGSGDFDGDGRADILWRATADGGFSYSSPAGGEAGTRFALATPADRNWRLLGIGDYDGDGRADILISSRKGAEVLACLTNGGAAPRWIPLGAAPWPDAGE